MIKLRVDKVLMLPPRIKCITFMGERGSVLYSTWNLSFSPEEFRDFTEMLKSSGIDVEVENCLKLN